MVDNGYYNKITEALQYIKSAAADFQPKTGIVLGSGLGKITDEVDEPVVIDTAQIPH